MIPREKIDEIISRTDIGALIGKYVTLKQSGKSLKGLCPFHNEKTPSFIVHPDKGFYKCFGCGEGGGPIQFLMKIEGIGFFEAVNILADQVGVNIVTSSTEKKVLTEKEILRKIMKAAVIIYSETLLNSPMGKGAKKYFAQRGIDIKTAVKFKLGYAPDMGEYLVGKMRSRNFKYEQMEKVGLARRGRRDYYDYFKGRIIFPIADSQGRFVGMGGRGLREGSSPKYLNTPQSLIFSKKNILYGLHLAKASIRQEGWVYVVEGYMDVLTLSQAGIENVVASMGTALTEEQARVLSRYTKRVIFAYDADIAGQSATLRGIEIFEKTGLQIKIMSMPKGEDPDSIIQKKGVNFFKSLSQKSKSIINYKIDFLKAQLNLDTPEGKEEFIGQIVPILKGIRGDVRRWEYIRIISERFKVSEALLGRLVSNKRVRKKGINLSSSFTEEVLTPEEKLLAYLFSNPHYISLCRQHGGFFSEIDMGEDLFYMYSNLLELELDKVEVIGADIINKIVKDDKMLKRAIDLSMVEGLPACNEEEILAILQGISKKADNRLDILDQELINKKLAQGTLTPEDPLFIRYMERKRKLRGSF